MRRVLVLGVLGCGIVVHAQAIHGRAGIHLPSPPVADTAPVTDDYFGSKITDNYRWLEDAKSAQMRAFIDEENGYTARYMKQARIRSQVADDLDGLEHVSRWSLPVERNGSYFFLKRIAGEDQSSIYVRPAWTGKDERLIDPTQLSRNPNTSVTLAAVSRDGSRIAYGVRTGGADETTLHIFDLKEKKTLEDELPAGLYRSVNFTPDGKGIFYCRQTRQGTLMYEHEFGSRISRDPLIFGHEFRGEPLGPIDLFHASITEDWRYLVITIDRGVPAKRVDIVYRDLTKPGSPFDLIVWGIDSRFSVIHAGNGWYVKTDYHAPNGCILKADLGGIMPDVWTKIVPEGPHVIEDFSIVGSKLYVKRLRDVKTEITAYTLTGKPAGTIDLGGMGSASAIRGQPGERYGFFSFESFIQPPTLYRLDTLTGKREIFAQPKVPFDTAQYELKQVFFKSKDGTRIPMFIAGKKGLKQNGTERLLMTGYGGFNLSMLPHWNPAWAWWLSQGGWFAQPNMRGGGEYGEKWHEEAMFEKKQNVFDDWFAAARYLIDNKYTSPDHFAISGRSNGGLLMGASMTQHPELFSAIWCGYPLLDMLRYQKFEQGPQWTTEYGSADNEKQFPYLLKYSPYQNVKPGTAYPAIMFFTGDSDTRVDPLHARKMTALMQVSSTSGRPILLHYSLAGGHSEGVSVEQQIQDDADQLTFLWIETGPVSPHAASPK
ncbi:MAG TPA: prolyl oligopeptidase family serine peptidase [Terracidiphilus sp.]|jgi:prolyl oligopeptidase|nr:prolyl oligopeptidase family serine peptidase [Terracidiphilus sp.]